MKQKSIYFAMMVILSLSCSHLSASPLQEGGKPTPAFANILKTVDISPNNSLEDIHRSLKEKFGRRPGQERWQVSPVHQEKKKKLIPSLKALGMVTQTLPRDNHYDTIILYGATVSSMRRSVQFLDTLWASGLRADNIVYLAGERSLDPQIESENVLFDPAHSKTPFRKGWKHPAKAPNHEAEAAAFVWEQIIKSKDLRAKAVQYISVPLKLDGKTGVLLRPNTAMTIQAWLETQPKFGKWLTISPNPYRLYQEAVTRQCLKEQGVLEKVSLETVGPEAIKAVPLVTYLNTLQLWLGVELAEEQKTRLEVKATGSAA